jgi:hypothetical protein
MYLSASLQRRPPQGWINTTGRRRPTTNPQDCRLFCYYEHRGARRPAKLFASLALEFLRQLWPFERARMRNSAGCSHSLYVSFSFPAGALALCKCGPRLRAPESQPICNKFHSSGRVPLDWITRQRLFVYNILTARGKGFMD